MKTYLFTLAAATALLAAGCSQKSSVEKASQEFNSLPPAVQQAVRSQAPNAEIASVDKKTRDGQPYYVIALKHPDAKLSVAQDGTLLGTEKGTSVGAPSTAPDVVTGSGAKRDTNAAPSGPTSRTAKIDLSALPVPVQQTLQQQAPNAEIADISRKEENGRVIYQFEFVDKGKNPTMRIAEDGSVVQSLQK